MTTLHELIDLSHALGHPDLDAAILGGNALDWYHFDADKLAEVAARIGPEKRALAG